MLISNYSRPSNFYLSLLLLGYGNDSNIPKTSMLSCTDGMCLSDILRE